MANTSVEPPQFQISQIPPPPPSSSSESGPPPPPPPPAHHHQSQPPTESEQQQLTSESEDVIPPPPPAPENFDALLMDSGKSDVAPASTTSTNNSQTLILSKGFFDGITLPTVDPFVVADSVLFQPALYLFKVSLLPVNLATSLMTPDEDKALEYAAALAIQNMKKISTLTSSSTLLIAALKLFDELRLNSIRPLFKKRIQQIIVFIGQSSGGLHSYCTQYSKVFTAEHLYKLENHIYKAMKCFKKFTRDDFVQHTFCGKEPQINFGTFEKDTLQECLNLTDLFNFKNKYLLPVQLSYYVVCDLKNGVLNAASDPQAMTTMGQVDFGLEPGSEDYENFQAEVYKTANSILELQTEAEFLCSYYPAEIIANKAMRNFWKKNFEQAVTATLVDFESSIYSDLKAFGEEDTSALALAYALVYAIKTTTTPSYKLYEEEHINYLELDRMLRPIDPSESLTNTVTELTTKIVSNSCRIVPKHIATLDSIFGATNLSEVVWDDFQRDEMVTVFNSNTGWISVCGPKFCGKSCRILDALSLIPIDRDCVYIDMAKVSTEMECTSRIVSQLHLMECNTKESFTSKFNTFLSELKFGSVVVFDNLDGDDKDETISSFSSFASSILKHCEPFETSLCFVIVGRHMTNLSFAVQTINIPPLQADVAVKFAQSLLPADPVALAKASQGLPGLMYNLTMKCNLDTIRAIATNVTADPSTMREVYGPNAGGMSYDVNASLGDDERLLASCFLKVSASFGPAMSWYMAKASFKDDITRWYLAWKGLVAKGWLSADGVINYFVPREATISSSADGSAPTMEEQWQRYCMFWAQHIQDVSFCCEESLMPWEDFDQFRQHYKNMLGYFFKQQNSSETPFVNLSELAFILSGCIVRLLNFRFSPEGGVLLANAIVASIDSTVETNAVAYLKAVTDLAVQMRRAERSVEAIRLMEKVQKSHEKLVTDGEVLGRFFAVLGNLHHSKNRLRKADEIYTKALQQWDSIGLTEDTHRANKLTKERQEVLRQQRGCKTCTIS